MADDQLFIRSRGKISGPFTREKIRELARRGRFSRQHQVSLDGKKWHRAVEFPDLFPATERRVRTPPTVVSAPEKRLFSDTHTGHLARDAPDQPAAGEEVYDMHPTINPNDQADPSPARAGWYYTHVGEEHGPVSFEGLQALTESNELLSDDYVWTEGMMSWTEARQVPELFSRIPEESPPVVDEEVVIYPGSTRTSPQAVASLVLGLCGTSILFFVGSIMAVIFGHIALARIRNHPYEWTGRGLALTGMVLGYLVIVGTCLVAVVMAVISAVGS